MKSLYGVVLLAACLALAHAYPGRANRESSESDEEKGTGEGVVLVLPSPRRDIFNDFATDVDDEPSVPSFWHPFRFNSSPFSDLYSRMQETMNRIRAQMAAALASQLGQGGLTPWGKIPEGANTTSTTKIIGDHAVTINETTYSDGDENGGTVFRVRVVDIKPLNDTATINDSEEEEAVDGEETTQRSEPNKMSRARQPTTPPRRTTTSARN